MWIAIELEQLALDVCDDLRTRHPSELLAEHFVVRVEVTEVVGGDGTELVEHLARQTDVACNLVAVLVEQHRQDVVAVHADRAHPREVVEPDLVDDDARGLDAEARRKVSLEADRHVAQAHGAVPGVEQCSRHDPDRVGEVDDPRTVGPELAHTVGNLEHDGNRAHGLRETAGSRRLLPDAAARQRCRLVLQPRLLAAYTDLDEDEVGPLDRPVELVGHLERAAKALPIEHARRHATDNLAPLGIDVVQYELRDVEPRQPGDELGRVRRPAADDRDLHPVAPAISARSACAT